MENQLPDAGTAIEILKWICGILVSTVVALAGAITAMFFIMRVDGKTTSQLFASSTDKMSDAINDLTMEMKEARRAKP